MTGICAEVRVEGPAVCQLATHAGSSGTITSVSRGSTPADGGTVTEEFTVSDDAAWLSTFESEPIFSYGEQTVHRFSRPANQGCVCELVEQSGCAVRDIQIVDGSVLVTFMTTDLQTIRDVVSDLKASHEGVQIRRLTRSQEDDDGTRRTIVDLDVLTTRQREVLETAHEMGYFSHPKCASAGEVAEALDIATPTFTEHLSAAQHKLLDELLERSRTARSERQ
ncbi:helix-turn-helix domain-containing protein [Halapricum hydrolyticum]|uniref:Helix-turn-helix domain-containing protein n=1 Tax=Halapricum hydrolyticum TaxID=2979991 RepID=A0AAE3IBD8_9EURY|nr:helix-turn-helix domain-containing protein [Halapricum hydrolyticum]MCU4716961.1 helix-turn-helix domain-containing protein [Halapricum hydrolyticum]MCU4725434.1 helix-turn-helix domain-containing protein [Halapricum hydrolyticum]